MRIGIYPSLFYYADFESFFTNKSLSVKKFQTPSLFYKPSMKIHLPFFLWVPKISDSMLHVFYPLHRTWCVYSSICY